MMLALFPFTIFALSLTRAVTQDYATEDIVEFIYGTWPDNIAEPIVKEVMAVLRDSNVGSMTIGGLLALFFASSGVDALRQALTSAYHDHDPRPLWKSRAVCVLFVLGGSAFLSVAAILTFAVPVYIDAVYGRLDISTENISSFGALRNTFSFVLLIFTVIACHLWLTGQRHTLKQVLPGVVLTMGLWMAAGKAFAYYVSGFSSYSITYAGLAGVMAALVFIYIMAIIFVFGGEFNGRLIEARQKTDAS
jgi:membrane protein